MPPASRTAVPRALVISLAVAFALVVGVPALSGFATDWLWFREIGFEVVFLKSFNWRSSLFAGGALAAFGLLHLNVRLARRGQVGQALMLLQLGEGAQVDIGRVVPRLVQGAALVVALMFGGALAA